MSDAILLAEIGEWTKKYDRLRLLLTKELGLADFNDLKAAEARGYRKALERLRKGGGYESWCADTGRYEGNRVDLADYLEAIEGDAR